MHDNKRTGYDKTVRNPRPRTLKRKNPGCDQTNRGQDALVEQSIERRSGDTEELHRLVKRDQPLSNKLVVSHNDHLPVV